MRDEIDGRIWDTHHDQFSEWIDGVIGAAAARLRRSGAGAGQVPGQLFATLAAVGLTLLTFTASAA